MALELNQLLPQETLTQKKPFAICFTGPRPKKLFDYKDRRPYNEMVGYMVPLLRELADAGCTKFISGGAQGVDQLAFWAVNHVKKTNPNVENALYLPSPNQSDRWARQGMFGQDEYQLMISKADSVKYISDKPTTSMAEASKVLTERNHAMVRDSDLVFAMLHGESLDWPRAKGGTAECVRYAHKQGCNIIAVRYQEGPQRLTTIQNIISPGQNQRNHEPTVHNVSDMRLQSNTTPSGPSCEF